MSEAIFEPLPELDVEGIENVFIYVCDALRWDFRPERVTEMGRTLRTMSHGLYTPPSMASLVTGWYPPRHGATRFDTTIPEGRDSLFEIQNRNTSLRHNQWSGHPLFGLLGQPVGPGIETLDPPFVFVEHDHGAHAPYPDLDANVRETFSHLSRQPEELRRHYRRGIQESVDRFEARLDALEDRGLREETLVLFASDHGELLGEYGGFVGHSLPATPELVYVPTIFVHPSLESTGTARGVIEHVDLLPTIREILGVGPPRGTTYDGRSLLGSIPVDQVGYNHGIVHFPGDDWLLSTLDPVYYSQSTWTRDGGHVVVRSNPLKRLATSLYDATRSAETGAFNRGVNRFTMIRNALSMYRPSTRTFGDPAISFDEAQSMIDGFSDPTNGINSELSGETLQHLENLGYR